VDPHAVGDVNRLVRVVDADMHVNAEDQLLASHEPKRRDQVAVARSGHDSLVLPHRERVRARRSQRQAALLGGLLGDPAELLQL
jgi:hypothetical protein